MSRKNIKVKNIPYTYKHKEVKMTSEKREWYEGATYHILHQGDIIEMIYLEMKKILKYI